LLEKKSVRNTGVNKLTIAHQLNVYNAHKIYRTHYRFQGKTLVGDFEQLEELRRRQDSDKKSFSEISRTMLYENTESRCNAPARRALCKY